MTLLLVDDSEGNRLSLGFMLEDEGFVVDTAASFAEGKALIESGGPYAVVLLDQQLGDGLGQDLVPLVRARHPDAKVAMMSGGEVDVVVDAHLVKGMDPAMMLSIVHRLAGRP